MFKKWLVKVRVGYACGLLEDKSKSISQISFECRFENLSNLNQLFKKVKGCTPSKFKTQLNNAKYLKPILRNVGNNYLIL